MWTAAIVVGDPFAENLFGDVPRGWRVSQSRHSRRIVPIRRSQTRSPAASGARDVPSTQSLGPHAPNRCCRDCGGRSDGMSPGLRPPGTVGWSLSGGMLGGIPMEDGTRADFDDDEVEDAEADHHGRGAITSHDRGRMIPHKRRPSLKLSPPRQGHTVRRYRPTVRGDTVSPSFRRSAFAIRSSSG